MSDIQPTGFGIVCARSKSIYHLLTRTLSKDKHDLIGFYYMAAAAPKLMSPSQKSSPKYSVLLYDVNSGCITSIDTLPWNTLIEDSQIESITFSQLICPDPRMKKEFEIEFQTFVTTLITERANTNQSKHRELIERGIHQRLLSVLKENINLKTGYVIVNSILSILGTICLGSHIRHTSVPDDMLLDSSLLQSPITFSINPASTSTESRYMSGSSTFTDSRSIFISSRDMSDTPSINTRSHCDFGIHLVIFCNTVRYLLTTREDLLHYVVSSIEEFSSNRKMEEILMDATTVSSINDSVETETESKPRDDIMTKVEKLLSIETMLLQAMDSKEYSQAIILVEELNIVRSEIKPCLPVPMPGILQESNNVVSEISKLRDYVDDILGQISTGTIPIIRMEEIVHKVNSLCKLTHIDLIQIDSDEFSSSYPCILTLDPDLEVNPDVKVELKSGDNIILPVANANVSGISTPVLIEILHYLNGLPYREKRFTPLRISITAEIAKRRV